ncbi:MAG TPA: hypothetical protein VJI13_03740 [Candidatus Norongarragalinales archaeon]|nr:hypothetical protein [Candidatus Norongarragalinales archaeon]
MIAIRNYVHRPVEETEFHDVADLAATRLLKSWPAGKSRENTDDRSSDIWRAQLSHHEHVANTLKAHLVAHHPEPRAQTYGSFFKDRIVAGSHVGPFKSDISVPMVNIATALREFAQINGLGKIDVERDVADFHFFVGKEGHGKWVHDKHLSEGTEFAKRAGYKLAIMFTGDHLMGGEHIKMQEREGWVRLPLGNLRVYKLGLPAYVMVKIIADPPQEVKQTDSWWRSWGAKLRTRFGKFTRR